jgi:hypothetical protein
MSKYQRFIEALAITALIIHSAAYAEEFNGTTYRLGSSQMEVTVPVNASRLNLTLHHQTSNMTLLDGKGKMVGVNSSYSFWRGEHNYNLVFEKHVSGELVYSLPYQGQQFILPLTNSGPVRVVLPPGYATGNHILGIARPDPDEIGIDKGSMAITWQNASRYQMIEVSYYRENAPETLMKIFAVLAAAGILLLIEYYASIRRLRTIREDAEKKGKIQQ